MNSLATVVVCLFIAAANAQIFTPSPSVNLGGCQQSALQASDTITFDGVTTVIESGDVGVAPGTSITGSFRVCLKKSFL